MDVNEDNTVHLNTNIGKRITLLLHLQMIMNVSIRVITKLPNSEQFTKGKSKLIII